MSDVIEDLARRLVVGRKRDGRSVYDEAAKAELVAACGKPGASVSRLARECGVNANQLGRWVREHGQRLQRSLTVPPATSPAFVAVPIEAVPPVPAASVDAPGELRLGLQARLPNGVVVDLRDCDLHQACEVIDALGRLRCSASTKP